MAHAIGVEVDAERAHDPQLLVDEMVGLESRRTTATTCPRDHDRPTWTSQGHSLGEGGGCLRGDVDDHVRETTRRSFERGRRIVDGHIDGQVDTESMSDVETVTIARAETGQRHERRTRLLRSNGGTKTADARAEDDDDITGFRFRDRRSPTDTCTKRVEHSCQHRVERVGDREQHRIGRQMEMRRIPAPQARCDLGVDEAEHRGEPVTDAAPVLAACARLALPARAEHLDGNPIACRDVRSPGGGVADLVDDADDLVTGDERERGGDVSAVLLVIGATQTAGLDAEPRRVGGDVGEVEPDDARACSVR